MKYVLVALVGMILIACKKETQTPIASIKILSPDSTTFVHKGQRLTITWTTTGIAANEDIYIFAWHKPYDNMLMPWYVAKTTNTGSIVVNVPDDALPGKWNMQISSGAYTHKISFFIAP